MTTYPSEPAPSASPSPAASNEPAAPRIQVTAEAVAFARKKRVEVGKPNAALRVGVKGGGCAGLTYVTDYTDEPPRDRDLVYEFFGLPVYVDNRSIKFIEGATLR